MGNGNFSAAELEAIGRLVGNSMRESQEKVFGKVAEGTSLKKMVQDEVRTILRKSVSGHGVPWQAPLPPEDVFRLEKALYEPAGKSDELIRLQKWNDEVYTLCSILKVHPTQLASYGTFEKQWSELSKALNTQTAGSGLEWVPTGYSSRMIEFVEIAAMVANQFQSFQQPTSTYVYPVLLSDGTAYLGSEQTSNSPSMYRASTPGTDNLTFVAKKLIANYPVSDEMTEESIVPVLPVLQASIARAMAKAMDTAIINGDTSTTHFDTGYTVGTDDARRAWIGLRKMVSDANGTLGLKQDGSTWTSALGLGLLRALVEDMKVYGLAASDLTLLLNTNMFNKYKSLDQVSTTDKFGTAATIKNGTLTGVDGIGFTLSQHVEEMQNDTGIYDGTTTIDTQFLLVHKPSFIRGVMRGMTLERVRKPLYGNEYLVSTMRTAWKCIRDYLTEPVAGWSYNITK